jgi:alginate O-acetyltransferase complex protein AlgI
MPNMGLTCKRAADMLFNSPEFLFGFLPVTLGATWLVTYLWGRSAGIYFLIFASTFFYGWWDLRGIAAIVLSVTVSFLCASLMARDKRPWLKLTALWCGIAFNLGALAYFKYKNFFLSAFGFHGAPIVLPLAISFYSFQQIAFLVDTYHCRLCNLRFRDYVVSVLFFPHLIAGPLIHYNRIMEQFVNTFAVSADTISAGFPIFCLGLAKKVALADPLASFVNPLFAQAETGSLEFFSAWIAALGYTAQLYFDFSGYSDMAIGLGLMFGIVLPLNFNSPYRARSIIDFWRRWHMTLSEFLRTYLYVPLGGSRVGQLRQNVNLFVVMLLGGLWHGAGWTFVFWGGLHGTYLIINHLWRDIVSPNAPAPVAAFVGAFSWLLTFTAVVMAWVFFRASTFTAAVNVLWGMVGLTFNSLPGEIVYLIGPEMTNAVPARFTSQGMHYGDFVVAVTFLAISYGIIFIPTSAAAQSTGLLAGVTPTTAFAIGVMLWLACFGVIGSVPSEFIYFRF